MSGLTPCEKESRMNTNEMTWLGIDAKTLMEEIMVRGSCNRKTAEGLTESVINLDPALRNDFRQFWISGNPESSFSCGEYTLSRIMDQWGIEPIGAFETLDWLIKEPEKAKEALKQGYDRIVFKDD